MATIFSPIHEEQVNLDLQTATPRVVKSALSTLSSSFPNLLPPSPAAVTDLVERQSQHLASTASAYWSSHIDLSSPLHTLRSALSTPLGLQASLLLLEAYGLQSRTLPWRYAFTLPLPLATTFANTTTTTLDVKVPDFFALLGPAFWGPTILWTSTSLLLPMLAGWFFNLPLASSSSKARRRTEYRVDPLAFNVAKALLAWLVYENGARLGGLVSRASVETVRESLPGGVWGVLVGTAIGGLGGLYEAVLAE